MCEYTSTIIITEDVNMEKYIYDKNKRRAVSGCASVR